MTYTQKSRDEHLDNDGQPKRILALDGGGLRGILTLGILQKIENILRDRHGNDSGFRLCHYFDLIAGTSTGAIIAATLAMGWTVEQVRKKYMDLGKTVFERSLLRQGLLRAKYPAAKLIEELRGVFGERTTLGGPELQTGLLVMSKRLDSGSPWPMSNNPQGTYFASRTGGVIGNGEYPLWQVVRSSTAAPAFFDPESITIIEKPGQKTVQGDFVDGGVSPFNNPAFQAFMYATISGYRIGWQTGRENILLVSVGTGTADPEVKRAAIAAQNALHSLLSLMNDCASFQETMLQWMSSSRTAREIDRELGDLQHDLVAGTPLLSYLRYNADLRVEKVKSLYPELTDEERIKSLSAMDAPENMETLHELGKRVAERDVIETDFAAVFDLK
jgi:hypothetical protein